MVCVRHADLGCNALSFGFLFLFISHSAAFDWLRRQRFLEIYSIAPTDDVHI
jgi:hypothetical protein